MQPKHVSNDLFNYHLQHLVKKGFVSKSDDGYTLSDQGIKYVADPYTSTDSIASLFKINVIIILSRVTDGKIEILNQIRKSNPSYGKVGVIGGVVRKGEMIEDAGSRKLKQETGLIAQCRLVGSERRMMYKSGELFSDVLFPIVYAHAHSGDLLVDSDFGHNMWVPIGEAIANESTTFDSIAGIVTVLGAIQTGTIDTLPFFFTETIQSDSLE
jgi:hypothetical protein